VRADRVCARDHVLLCHSIPTAPGNRACATHDCERADVSPHDGDQTASSARAEASAASTAATSARADAAVSSTATLAPGPRDGSAKSMLSVCSAMAWTGWSKYTVPSVTWNHLLSGPLALPVSSVVTVA